MNGILSKSSESRSHNVRNTRPRESVETAGSLAMNTFHSLFEVNTYDMFITDSPFAIDYSMYSDCGETVAYSGFLSSFSNAVSVISSGFSDGGFSGGGFSDCGFSGASCGASSGGSFTSFC